MIIAELIEELMKFPPQMEVEIDSEFGACDISCVTVYTSQNIARVLITDDADSWSMTD